MAEEHQVKPGECVCSISFDYGFFRSTIEDHPRNAELQRQRKDLTMLLPGDVLYIPDKVKKQAPGDTNLRHRFRRRGVPEVLHLRLLDRNGEPRANLPYKLAVEERHYQGKTDAAGALRHFISPAAKTGELIVSGKDGDETYQLQLGRMPPLDQIVGVQTRLHNLGLFGGPYSGEIDAETRHALLRFQDLNHLECSGKLDEPTKAKLKSGYQG